MKTTIPVPVGNITIGGNSPVIIQSMTDTDTADISATVRQILELSKAGSELVRITIDSPPSAEAVPHIVERVRKYSSVPIVGDFHFHGHILLQKYPDMAKALDKYRINPGNVGRGKKRDEQFEKILSVAKKYKKPIRIGGNGGSLDPYILQQKMDAYAGKSHASHLPFEEAMIESVLSSARYAVEHGVPPNAIVLSAKVSNPRSLFRIYHALSRKTDFPLHLGLTEAGGGVKGIVETTAALTPLLQAGIGDTVRVSLTPSPGELRTKEVEVAQAIVQAAGVRQFFPKIISCPGCGRTAGNRFQLFVETITQKIKQKLPLWKEKNPKITSLTIAVMGCIVNGPGEATHADIGIFFPGKGEGTQAIVVVRGKAKKHLRGNDIAHQFLKIVEEEFV